jgi:hypothetical protein
MRILERYINNRRIACIKEVERIEAKVNSAKKEMLLEDKGEGRSDTHDLRWL